MMVEASALGTGFTVIMPMKPWDRAKSRLHVEPHARRALAGAFARDTLEAVLHCPDVQEVVVVTRGDLVVKYVRCAGAHVIQEPTDRPLDTLGSAIRHGIAWAAERRPHAPVAVIPSDLPALTSRALSALLREVAGHPLAFVADAGGDGTTILTSRTPGQMHAGYGPDSAERHRSYRAFEITDADPVLRRDVDVFADLIQAHRLGLGPNTLRTFVHLTAEDAQAQRFVATF
ncbi:2-phospho-L-lactate guanylyltransferase [Aeromicrobium sp.]|uniref:2-phospho-L-lactate guanylyltransferase n=1 Tax=Aeromicrobium sp. TaxID=1871063 RepID=UPI0030EDF96D